MSLAVLKVCFYISADLTIFVPTSLVTRVSSIFKKSLIFIADFFGTCVFDDKHSRVLKGYVEETDDMTIQKCLSICRSKGFHFAGLEWQIECHCGDEKGFEWAWPSKCNEKCIGDSRQICGGVGAASVWTVPPKNLYGLCIYDFSDERVIDGYWITEVENLTIEVCSHICEGTESFGRISKISPKNVSKSM